VPILIRIYEYSFKMASEDSKDMLKNVDWKTVGGAVTTESSQPVMKKRLPKKIRQVPECYFLPRRSLPSALAFYGAVCAAGVGAGMLLEVWINKKIKGAFSCYMAWQKRPLYGLMNCIRYYI
jgi:hypothetical protein